MTQCHCWPFLDSLQQNPVGLLSVCIFSTLSGPSHNLPQNCTKQFDSVNQLTSVPGGGHPSLSLLIGLQGSTLVARLPLGNPSAPLKNIPSVTGNL